MTIKFIADSAADLPQNIIDEFDIDTFPLYIHHGDDDHYKDGIDMKSDDLYKRMKAGENFKTSQVAVNDFYKKFCKYAENGEKVIYLSLSSALSGTFQFAVLAKQQVLEDFPEFDLTIIDSRSASMGIGLAIYKTIKDYKNGLSEDKLIEKAKYYSTHMEHIFTVDNLDYLVKGGRLNKVSGFVGSILNIKPIIEINDGSLEALEKKKGSKRVMKRIVELLKERATNLDNQTIAIAHAGDREAAEKLKSKIEEKSDCNSIIITDIGAVIGVHTGPGAYGVFFINEDKDINKVNIR